MRLSLDGQSPRDLALQDPGASGRTTAFVRLPLPFRGPASITGSRFINFQLCQAHFTFLFSSVFEGKHVNRVGCFSCYKCGSRGAEGSSPTGRLVAHRRARPPPVSFLRLRAPLLPAGPLLLLSPLPGASLWAQVAHPSVSAHHFSGSLPDAPTRARFPC